MVKGMEAIPFLLLFGTAMVCFMGGFVFLGLLAGAVLLAIFVGLLTTGVLSVSVITGWYKKSVVKGISSQSIYDDYLANLDTRKQILPKGNDNPFSFN